MKVHGNKENALKRVADNELFQPVTVSCSHGSGMGKTGIGLWMGASMSSKSAKPTERQLGAWVKDPTIWSKI
jgi:hypothetical protein